MFHNERYRWENYLERKALVKKMLKDEIRTRGQVKVNGVEGSFRTILSY